MTSTAIVPHDREEWLSLRTSTVGGSEIASLFYLWQLADGSIAYLHLFERPPAGATMLGCVSRHTTGYRLWWQKAGEIPADDLDDNERVRLGRHLEAGIAMAAAEKWSMRVRKVLRYERHQTIVGMGASRDYEEIAIGFPPVEIKNVDYLVFRDVWNANGDDIDAPPLDITLQVQHQIGTGRIRAGYGWIVACVGGSSLKRGRIERHNLTISKIEQAVAAFWRAVAAGTPPDAELADFDTVADISLLSPSCRAAPLDLTDDNRIATLCARGRKVKDIRDRADGAFNRIKAEIGLKMGGAVKAYAPGYSITWPIVQPRDGRAAYRGGMSIKESLVS